MELAFRAISDPSRREILDLLAEGRRTVSDLLRHFRFTQPAISKHLRVLREAGLVECEARGRERWYTLRADGLRSVADWLRHYERFWNTKLDKLDDILKSTRPR